MTIQSSDVPPETNIEWAAMHMSVEEVDSRVMFQGRLAVKPHPAGTGAGARRSPS